MSNTPIFSFTLCESLIKNCEGSDLEPDAFLPTKADPGATGWDVRCANKDGLTLVPGAFIKVSLGLRMLPESGWWAELKPRSSTFLKRHIHALYGTIDESYEGKMYFCGQYIPDEKDIITRSNYARINFGDRIGQLIPVQRQEMEVKSISNETYDKLVQERDFGRGTGGFGSTGDK